MTPSIKVLCVDDNFLVTEGLKTKLSMSGGFEWVGQLPNAEGLVELVQKTKPDVVLMDIDMPGPDAFEALRELSSLCPDVRTIMISGYVRNDLIDQAIEAGAWGYVAKGEAAEAIVDAIRRVARGEFALGPEVQSEYRPR